MAPIDDEIPAKVRLFGGQNPIRQPGVVVPVLPELLRDYAHDAPTATTPSTRYGRTRLFDRIAEADSRRQADQLLGQPGEIPFDPTQEIPAVVVALNLRHVDGFAVFDRAGNFQRWVERTL